MNEQFVNELATALRKVGTIHTVGEEWVSYIGEIPVGGVPYCGQMVTRATYSALWSYAQAKGLVLGEAEWQQYASTNGGNVPYYSSGDGSTTFRMPKISGYVKGASSQSVAGDYIAEGLPNITGAGNFTDMRTNTEQTYVGALYACGSGASQEGGGKVSTNTYLGFDASRSNSIYGNSEHVTPETSVVMFGVYAFGAIVETGALDATTLATGLATVESRLGALEPFGNIERVTSSGVNYTRFESGLQICFGADIFYASGTIVTFPVPFLNGDSYMVSANATYGASSNLGSVDQHIAIGNKTSTGFVGGTYGNSYSEWIAIGRWK